MPYSHVAFKALHVFTTEHIANQSSRFSKNEPTLMAGCNTGRILATVLQ